MVWIKIPCYYHLIQSLYHGTTSALSKGGGGGALVTYDSYTPPPPPPPYTHIWCRCFVGVCVSVSASVLIKSIEGARTLADWLPWRGWTSYREWRSERLMTHRRLLYSAHTFFPHLSLIALFMSAVHSQFLYFSSSYITWILF